METYGNGNILIIIKVTWCAMLRGDSSDFSACHVFDVEGHPQVAEYKGKLDTKDFGNFLVYSY